MPVVSSMAATWVALDSSTQASPPGAAASCASSTETGAGSISLLSDSLQESNFWCRHGDPTLTAVPSPRASEEGAGSGAKPAASAVALSMGSHSSSTAASRRTGLCIAGGQCHWQA